MSVLPSKTQPRVTKALSLMISLQLKIAVRENPNASLSSCAKTMTEVRQSGRIEFAEIE